MMPDSIKGAVSQSQECPPDRTGELPSPRSREGSDFTRDEFTLQLRFSDLGQLYGRGVESLQLQQAYDRVRGKSGEGPFSSSLSTDGTSSSLGLPTTSREIVLVSGYSGTGKSALAHQLRKRVKRAGGFFASGKFDMQQRMEPYTAFVKAFSDLCDDIVTSLGRRNSSSLSELQRAVSEAVGSEGKLLADFIPSFHRLVDKDWQTKQDQAVTVADTAVQYVEAKNRFNFILRKFVRAISTPVHPLVLFLDDLQWADVPSLDLMEMLVTDVENPCILLLGCYRDNEVDEVTSPLSKCIQEIERREVSMTKISLGNLDLEAVNELIADLLSVSPSDTQKLAEIVHHKTLGNVFFVVQFLKSLHDEGLLWYCLATLKWRWDEGVIKTSKDVTDNVVDLMKTKLCKLPQTIQHMLQVASCLGSLFEASTLALVIGTLRDHDMNNQGAEAEEKGRSRESESDVNNVLCLLDLCVNEGLLCKAETGKDKSPVYHFVHDQIQQAAYSLIPEQEQDRLQFHIGEVLMEGSKPGELEKIIFVVVDLLNRGLHFVPQGDTKRAYLAELNLLAGQKAMESCAFVPAASYLKTGIDLLSPNCWRENYEVCRELFTTAAEAEYCNGNFERMRSYLNQVLMQEIPFEDKLRAHMTLIDSLGAENKMQEAIGASFFVLAQLGVRFPRFIGKCAVVLDLIRTKYLLRRCSIYTLSNLPVMEDELKIKTMRILDALGTFAYLAKPDLLPLVLLRMLQWSIRFGVCKYSTTAFAGYGLILCGALGDHNGGLQFGKLALSLLKRLNAKDRQARTLLIVHTFINHWVNPIQLSLKPFMSGYQIGMESGDIESAMFNIQLYCTCALYQGRPLVQVESDIRTYSRQMKEYGQDIAYNRMLPTWQYVLNLMGHSTDPIVMAGEAMDQEVMLRIAAAARDKWQEYFVKTYQVRLAYYFGDYAAAWSLASETIDIENVFPAHFILRRCIFFVGLVSFALARQTKKRKCRKCGIGAMKRLKKWAASGGVNSVYMLHLLEAENAALSGNDKIARKKYGLAISAAARYGAMQDKALAHERAGEFCSAVGDKYWASHHLGLAYQLFAEWGAQAKADHLCATRSDFLTHYDEINANSCLS